MRDHAGDGGGRGVEGGAEVVRRLLRLSAAQRLLALDLRVRVGLRVVVRLGLGLELGLGLASSPSTLELGLGLGLGLGIGIGLGVGIGVGVGLGLGIGVGLASSPSTFEAKPSRTAALVATPDSSSHSAAAETAPSRPLALTVLMAPPAPRRTTSRFGHLDMQADALTSRLSSPQPSAATASSRSAPPLRVQAPPKQTSSFSEATRVLSEQQQKRSRSVLRVLRRRLRIVGMPDAANWRGACSGQLERSRRVSHVGLTAHSAASEQSSNSA